MTIYVAHTPCHLHEADWPNIKHKLAVTLHEASCSAKPPLSKNWHFSHWMINHGTDFFFFFQNEQKEHPERLILWWGSYHIADIKSKVPPQIASKAWEEISGAWDAFSKKPVLEAA